MFWDSGKAGAMSYRLAVVFPAWLVLWGAYTREFWAFPRFAAEPGTVLHAADPGVLAGRMHQVQRAAAERAVAGRPGRLGRAAGARR